MVLRTFWKPISINTALALGFPDFKDMYNRPLFIKVTSKGTMDKREMLAIGCEQLPEGAEIIKEDFVIPKE
jgi:hypothetical protein